MNIMVSENGAENVDETIMELEINSSMNLKVTSERCQRLSRAIMDYFVFECVLLMHALYKDDFERCNQG